MASLAACGDESTVVPGAPADETTDATTDVTADAAGVASTLEKSTMTKPTVTVPTGPSPTTLVTEDLVAGTGAEATKGTTVSVHYVGVHYVDGSQFDASWDRGQPLEFTIGAGQVIAGWDQGVEGMKVGGRRQLVIPADLAYGPRGFPPVIQPNETLVFVVDLVAVR